MADFEDSSVGHTEVHTPTPNVGATIDTVTYKYGGGSGSFYNGNVTFPDSVDFEFGSAPFTISCWVYNPNAAKFWIHHQTTTADRLTLGIPYGNVIQFIGVRSSSIVVYISASIGTLTGWHHFEVSRDGSSGYIFIDGIKQTLGTNVYAGTMATPTDVFNVGLLQFAGDKSSGNFDCLKIDKGICRHTSDFTPPANENVDNDEYTVLLLKMNPVYVPVHYEITIDDGLSLTDSLCKDIAVTKSDGLSLTDSIGRGFAVTVSDDLYLSDSLCKDIAVIKSDGLSLTDTITKAINIIQYDWLWLTDAVKREIGLIKSDILWLTDEMIAQIRGQVTIDDGLFLSDSLNKGAGIYQHDYLYLYDSLYKGIGITHSDNLLLYDSVGKGIAVIQSDDIVLIDVLTKIIDLGIADSITLTDNVVEMIVGEIKLMFVCKKPGVKIKVEKPKLDFTGKKSEIDF